MPRLSKDKDLPTAITQLQLCPALKKCTHIGVEKAFDKSDDENLYVYDDPKIKYSDWNNDKHAVLLSKTFNAQNPNKNTLVLLPLDGRIITKRDFIRGGVCDCALLTDKELSFVEFKTNVLSSSKNLTILHSAQKAIRQLWHTYDGIIDTECKKMDVDILDYVSIDFYIVFDSELEVTGIRADFQNLQLDFLIEKKQSLYFENSKQFE